MNYSRNEGDCTVSSQQWDNWRAEILPKKLGFPANRIPSTLNSTVTIEDKNEDEDVFAFALAKYRCDKQEDGNIKVRYVVVSGNLNHYFEARKKVQDETRGWSTM